MELFTLIAIIGVLITIVILQIRSQIGVIPMEEKIAYTRRLIMNLIPITLLFVTDAENMFGRHTGDIKRAYVMDELYKRIPDEYKKYVIEENLDVIINQALEKALIFWKEHPQVLRS